MSLNIKTIQNSFEQAKPIGSEVVTKFYEILFKDYPQAKPLFSQVNMPKQINLLLNSLVYIVDHLDNEKKLHDYLFKMGQRHVPYGAKEEHYDWVGASLLKTFAFFFKEAWTEELHEQWEMAYGVVKSIMMDGQRSVAPESTDLRARASSICNSLLLEVLDEELDEGIIDVIRQKVRRTLLTCLEEESAKLLKKVG